MRVPVRSVVLSLALVGTGAAVLFASDPPYVGSWKLNPAKSNFGETTVTYEQAAGGQMKLTADGQSYTFQTDGKEYPTPWGKRPMEGRQREHVGSHEQGQREGRRHRHSEGRRGRQDPDRRRQEHQGDRRDVQRRGRLRAPGRRSGSGRQVEDEEPEDRLPGNVEHQPERVRWLDPDVRGGEGDLQCEVRRQGLPATGPTWPSGWMCAIAKTARRRST